MAWQWILCISFTASAATDVLIAGLMCWYLYRQRTGFSRQVCLCDLCGASWRSHSELIPHSQYWWFTVSIPVCWRGERLVYVNQSLNSNLSSVLGTVSIIVRIFGPKHLLFTLSYFMTSPQSHPLLWSAWQFSGCWANVRYNSHAQRR